MGFNGRRLTEEMSLRIFWIFGFGWRAAVFFAAVRSAGLSSVPGVFGALFSLWFSSTIMGSIGERGAVVKGQLAGGVFFWR